MTNETKFSRRKSLKVIAATGVVVGGSGTVLGGIPESSPLDLHRDDTADPPCQPGNSGDPAVWWEGQGSEHAAQQDCDYGYWKFVLTPGGSIGTIEEAPELTVVFADETEKAVDGELRPADQGAVHFHVYKEGGGAVECAWVEYDGGDNAQLVLGEGGCSEDGPEDGNPEDGDPENDGPENDDPGGNDPEDGDSEDGNSEDDEPEDDDSEDGDPKDDNPEDHDSGDDDSEDGDPQDDDSKDVDSENGNIPVTELDYWQVDFGEGEKPPRPPKYFPNDLMAALGNADEGVTENPSVRRQQTTGQLADVKINDLSFSFSHSAITNTSSVTVEFELAEDAEARSLHLAIFSLPGPFDETGVWDQELVAATSDTFEGGEKGMLTLQFP